MLDRRAATSERTARHVRFTGPILVLAALGCAASILGSDPRTGLDVTVRRGPIHPVGQPGVEDSAPVADARVRVRPVGDPGSADGTTDGEGTVGFSVPAGLYEVSVRVCPGALGLPEADTARVSRGVRTAVALVCDTGIR